MFSFKLTFVLVQLKVLGFGLVNLLGLNYLRVQVRELILNSYMKLIQTEPTDTSIQGNESKPPVC